MIKSPSRIITLSRNTIVDIQNRSRSGENAYADDDQSDKHERQTTQFLLIIVKPVWMHDVFYDLKTCPARR